MNIDAVKQWVLANKAGIAVGAIAALLIRGILR